MILVLAEVAVVGDPLLLAVSRIVGGVEIQEHSLGSTLFAPPSHIKL
jgi:hypothetical protein